MWYVIDKDYGIVVGSADTRADAYRTRRVLKTLNPDRRLRVDRNL